MSDEELARGLDIPIEFVAKIDPAKRGAYERLLETADALNRGERPAGVIVCGEH